MFRGRNILNIILAAVIAAHPFLAAAQDAMSWDDCIKAASDGNPDIRSATETYRSNAAKAKAAYSGFLPQISGEVDYNSGNYSSTSTGSFTTNTYSGSVSADQNVFAGFRDTGLVKQAAANRDASSSGLDNTKVKVSYDLKNAFAQMLYAQNDSKLQEDIIKRRNENWQLVNLRFEAGMENKGNELLSSAFLGQAKYDKRQAVRSIEVARQQLAKVMGKEDPSGINIKGKIPIEEPATEPKLIEVALKNPQYRQAVAQERSAKAAVTLAKSKFSPTLDVLASAQRTGNKWPPDTDNTSYGFNIGVPIFNGANNIFMLKSSQADLMTAKANRQSVEEQLLAKLKQTHAEFVDAYEKLKVDKTFLEAATVRADIARNRYRNGLLTFDNWDIIENDLISKQKAVIVSERSLYVAEAAWMQAQGKGVFK